jgi:hypothetical protein
MIIGVGDGRGKEPFNWAAKLTIIVEAVSEFPNPRDVDLIVVLMIESWTTMIWLAARTWQTIPDRDAFSGSQKELFLPAPIHGGILS